MNDPKGLPRTITVFPLPSNDSDKTVSFVMDDARKNYTVYLMKERGKRWSNEKLNRLFDEIMHQKH